MTTRTASPHREDATNVDTAPTLSGSAFGELLCSHYDFSITWDEVVKANLYMMELLILKCREAGYPVRSPAWIADPYVYNREERERKVKVALQSAGIKEVQHTHDSVRRETRYRITPGPGDISFANASDLSSPAGGGNEPKAERGAGED